MLICFTRNEAQRAVELVRCKKALSSQNFGSVNRWLFLRKLTTRVRLEHLWHDLKLLLDDISTLDPISDGSALSQRHLYLWQICMCMGSRIFDGLVFDKLHPGEDMTGHWTPYFNRYMAYLSLLEGEEAKFQQTPEQANANFQRQCNLAMLWLYFMGAAVEGLIFHRTEGRPTGVASEPKRIISSTHRFRCLYAETDFEQDRDISQIFEEDLLFSSDIFLALLDELTQAASPSVDDMAITDVRG